MTDEQRSQTGWIGVPKCEVIFARALSFGGHDGGQALPSGITEHEPVLTLTLPSPLRGEGIKEQEHFFTFF
jgi:hypothetical protein